MRCLAERPTELTAEVRRRQAGDPSEVPHAERFGVARIGQILRSQEMTSGRHHGRQSRTGEDPSPRDHRRRDVLRYSTRAESLPRILPPAIPACRVYGPAPHRLLERRWRRGQDLTRSRTPSPTRQVATSGPSPPSGAGRTRPCCGGSASSRPTAARIWRRRSGCRSCAPSTPSMAASRSSAAWFFTIARRRAIDSGRRRRRRPQVVGLEGVDAPHPVDMSEVVAGDAAVEAAITLLRQLRPDQAEVVALRVIGGLTVPETAAVVGRSDTAVRVLCHRGLRTLATCFTTDLVARAAHERRDPGDRGGHRAAARWRRRRFPACLVPGLAAARGGGPAAGNARRARPRRRGDGDVPRRSAPGPAPVGGRPAPVGRDQGRGRRRSAQRHLGDRRGGRRPATRTGAGDRRRRLRPGGHQRPGPRYARRRAR